MESLNRMVVCPRKLHLAPDLRKDELAVWSPAAGADQTRITAVSGHGAKVLWDNSVQRDGNQIKKQPHDTHGGGNARAGGDRKWPGGCSS